MSDPIIKLKRSSVSGKIPTTAQLPIGEIAINTNDGILYSTKTGIGTTVFALNPWAVGTGGASYDAYFTAGNIGIGETAPDAKLHVADEESTPSTIPGIYYSRLNNLAGDFANTDNADIRVVSHSSNYKMSIEDQNNTYLMVLKGDGKLGIGTDNPDQTLELFKASGTNLVKVTSQANSTVGLEIEKTGSTTQSWRIADGQTVNGALEFYDVTNTATRMIIRDGKVGINESNPSRNLSVYDASNAGVEIKSGTTGQSSVFFTDTADGNIGMIGYYHSDNSMFFRTNDAEAVRITSGGEVGIGTTNPGDWDSGANKLVISSTGNTGLTINTPHSTNRTGTIAFATDDSSSGGNEKNGAIVYVHGEQSTHFDKMHFSTGGRTSPYPFTILGAGRVGIMTHDPQNQFVISNGFGKHIEFNTGSTNRILNLDRGNSNAPLPLSVSANYLILETGTNTISEVLRITSAGNIGIGSEIPTTKLDVDGTVTATSFAGDGSNLTGITASTELSGDTTPQLGGDLDLNSNDITGTGNVNITGVITATSFDGNLATTNLTGTITNAQLGTGSIANDKLSNSSISYGGVPLSLGDADATPAFDLSDATNYPTSSLTGTITNAQLAGSIADGKLASTFLKNVVEDTSPQLGGDLDLNSNDITGTGNVNITGVITATSFAGDGSNLTGIAAGEFSLSATDKAIHSSAAGNSSSAFYSFFVGTNAGNNTTTGYNNNFIGNFAGNSNTNGGHNNFIGSQAGKSNTTGCYNNFFGRYAGCSNTCGGDNNFFGRLSGCSNTIGLHNNYFGSGAGKDNTTGCYNNFFGIDAGAGAYAATNTGSYNNFFGAQAGCSNSTGSHNNFFGARIANYPFTCQTGCHNNYFGCASGQLNTSGSHNNFFGCQAGTSNTTGSDNNFIGRCSGLENTTGCHNNFFGSGAGSCMTTGCYNNFFGINAGNGAYNATNTGCHNNFFGLQAGKNNTTGSHNNFFGASVADGGYAVNCQTGCHNNYFGCASGRVNTSGSYNNFFGRATGQANTTGSHNQFFGLCAGISNTCGGANIFIGQSAGRSNTTGCNNISIGDNAGCANNGSKNILIGPYVGYYLTTGSCNVIIGEYAGSQALSNTVAINAGTCQRIKVNDTGLYVNGSLLSGGGGGGASEAFKTIAVSGQSDVVADSATDTLTLVAGSNMTITTNASGDSVTFASSGGGGGASEAFKTIAVSGQNDVVADSATDTLTLVAGSNMTITTNASGDSITFASSGTGGGGSGGITTGKAIAMAMIFG